MRLFILEPGSQAPFLRLISSSWSSLQVICSNSESEITRLLGEDIICCLGGGKLECASSKNGQLGLNKIYSVMYGLALGSNLSLRRMIGLYVPGYKVWGHALPFSDVFIFLFQVIQTHEIMQLVSANKSTTYFLIPVRTESPLTAQNQELKQHSGPFWWKKNEVKKVSLSKYIWDINDLQ